MIAHAIIQLSQESPEIQRWLRFLLAPDADSIEVPGLSGNEVRVIARKNEQLRYFTLSCEKVFDYLESCADVDLGTAVAWLLLCFHDVYYDTDALLHDYVKNVCGVRLEWVPFFRKGANLTAMCDYSSCTGKPKKSDKVIFQVDKNIASVLLPLSNPELRDLFFGRLRRIDT